MQELNIPCPRCGTPLFQFYNSGYDAEVKCASCGYSTTPSDLRISRVRFVSEGNTKGESRFVTYEGGEGVLNIVEEPEIVSLFEKMKPQLGLKTDVLVEGYTQVATSLYPESEEPLIPRTVLERMFDNPEVWMDVATMQSRLFLETSNKYHMDASEEADRIRELVRSKSIKIDG